MEWVRFATFNLKHVIRLRTLFLITCVSLLLIFFTSYVLSQHASLADALVIHFGGHSAHNLAIVFIVHHLLPFFILMFLVDRYSETHIMKNSKYMLIRIRRIHDWLFSHVIAILLLTAIFFGIYIGLTLIVFGALYENFAFTLEFLQQEFAPIGKLSVFQFSIRLYVLLVSGSVTLSMFQLACNLRMRKMVGWGYLMVASIYVVNILIDDVSLWVGSHITPYKWNVIGTETYPLEWAFVGIQITMSSIFYFLAYFWFKRRRDI